MNEEVQFVIDSARESMEKAIGHLEKEFVKIRAGKASPAMLSSVMVEYYGSMTPLSQVSNINTPDGRTISVQPWEKSLIPEIESAIMNTQDSGSNVATRSDTSVSLLKSSPKTLLEGQTMRMSVACTNTVKAKDVNDDRLASVSRPSPVSWPTRIDVAMPMAKGKLR